ncbi:NAD(P)-dependent oxidoreductase [Gordonia sp. TBRC 11910]|uniref:NAD(P)-dependent oxidoreductase n=1 Tax=Gordonia asplenii TaxID=2725283 RepID=A0A848KVI1_9ACTN|nr:NAD(P)-binding domain-containing protein [Gordonia asplenii]NMO00875.1 NAD(P)-dependent oxidoreductase [Gordonia asplenii]
MNGDTSGNVTDISVIGVGNIGAAVVRSLLAAGHSVTVWNRSEERCAPLVDEGARLANSLRDAVQRSEVILLCLLDYSITARVLATDEVINALAGKTIVQFATGTPHKAESEFKWLAERRAYYIDGAILAYPRSVGTVDCKIICSGDRSTFDRIRPMLNSVGTVRHVGAKVSTANVLNLSVVGVFYEVAFAAFLEGAAFADAHGATIDEFMSVFPHVVSVLVESVEYSIPQMKSHDYTGSEASVDVHSEAMTQLRGALSAAGCRNVLMTGLVDYLKAAQSEGAGQLEFAALFETIRMSTSRS